jgi:hypothetical protein
MRKIEIILCLFVDYVRGTSSMQQASYRGYIQHYLGCSNGSNNASSTRSTLLRDVKLETQHLNVSIDWCSLYKEIRYQADDIRKFCDLTFLYRTYVWDSCLRCATCNRRDIFFFNRISSAAYFWTIIFICYRCIWKNKMKRVSLVKRT